MNRQSITQGLRRAAAITLVALGLSACSGLPQPELGRIEAADMERQIVNPNPVPAGPVEGVDGKVAEKAMAKYRKGLEEKSSRNSLFTVEHMNGGGESKDY